MGQYRGMLGDDERDSYTHHVPPPCVEAVGVVYVDEHILVVNKPAGLLSVPGRFVKDCVLHRMMFDYPESRIVHRLDLDTSGLLVLAQSDLATRDLNRQFRERVVLKHYEAMVFGCPENEEGQIDAAIMPDYDNRPRQRIDERGKAALTRYRCLERDEDQSRLRLMPETGRSHQLRIHLAWIGHPILGCDLYAHQRAFEAAERLCLHACGLGIEHPETGEFMTFESDVPF